jgi:hypothetical protein
MIPENQTSVASNVCSHAMSAIGPKQTRATALHMSAIGGKADMTVAACLLLRSLSGVKRTWLVAMHMSAFDPKTDIRIAAAPSIAAFDAQFVPPIGSKPAAFQKSLLFGSDRNLTKATAASGFSL